MLKQLNTQQLEKSAAMLKALAHPLRIAILELLENGEGKSVSTIHQNLGIEQAVASHHLAILRNKGLVSCERKGKNSFYFLRNQELSTVIACIQKCQESPHD